MNKPSLAVLLTGLLALPVAAWAETAWTTDYVNLRTGPDIDYPRVTFLRPGEAVEVHGCLEDYSWCDVDVYQLGERGWVAADYLDFEYDGTRVRVSHYGPSVGLAVVHFVLGSYWDLHYHHRPWYPQLSYYRARHPQHWAPPPRHYARPAVHGPVHRPPPPRPIAGGHRPPPPRMDGPGRGDRGQWRSGAGDRPWREAPARARHDGNGPGRSGPPASGNRPPPPRMANGAPPAQQPRDRAAQGQPRALPQPRHGGQWQPPGASPARLAQTPPPRPQGAGPRPAERGAWHGPERPRAPATPRGVGPRPDAAPVRVATTAPVVQPPSRQAPVSAPAARPQPGPARAQRHEGDSAGSQGRSEPRRGNRVPQGFGTR